MVQHSLYSPTRGLQAASIRAQTLWGIVTSLNRTSAQETAREVIADRQTALEKRFVSAQANLNPSRLKLLRMILEKPEDTYYLSSRELAKRCAVDAATIVRTIQVLGYRKFAEFLADLRSHFVTRITPYSVLKAASKEKRTVADRIRHNIELDLRNLQFLQSAVDSERIIGLSRRVKKARRILVVGIDLAASLSWYLAYGLMTLGFAAEAPIGSTGNVQRRVRTLTSRDLLIAISFGQCLRDTVEAAQRAKKQGVRTFGITDTGTSPLARICDDACFASVTSPSFVGSYVAPFSLMGALLTACAHTQTSRALELLRRSEEEDRADRRWYNAERDFNEIRKMTLK